MVGAAPGEFKWQPGALTQAVAKGLWVVIEDVDLAPFEVLAALVPLLEERRLYVPGRGESVPAAEGFQLFGTVTTGGGRAGGSAAAGARADPLAGLWARVAVEPPLADEPAEILCGLHPGLKPLAPPCSPPEHRAAHVRTGRAAAAPEAEAGKRTKKNNKKRKGKAEEDGEERRSGRTETTRWTCRKVVVKAGEMWWRSSNISIRRNRARGTAVVPHPARLTRWARRLEKLESPS